MIDFTKPVQTRDGRKVRILATDARTDYPVVGLVEQPVGIESTESWTLEGSWYSNGRLSSYDLVNVPGFDPTKPVQTRNGRPVRILATDRKHGEYPIVGLITRPCGEEELETWTKDGKTIDATSSHRNDLVNVPEENGENL